MFPIEKALVKNNGTYHYKHGPHTHIYQFEWDLKSAWVTWDILWVSWREELHSSILLAWFWKLYLVCFKMADKFYIQFRKIWNTGQKVSLGNAYILKNKT